MSLFSLQDRIILASSSPRRREMLAASGIEFQIEVPDCDESVREGEEPSAMVSRLSLLKAETAALKHQKKWILAADTTVVIDGLILGKPNDKEEAFAMLSRIQDRTHVVWGGIAFINSSLGIKDVASYSTEVEMRALNETQIRAYIASGEPMDKAGAYAIQGIGAGLVRTIKGSYTNVVGLNLSAVYDLLAKYSLKQE